METKCRSIRRTYQMVLGSGFLHRPQQLDHPQKGTEMSRPCFRRPGQGGCDQPGQKRPILPLLIEEPSPAKFRNRGVVRTQESHGVGNGTMKQDLAVVDLARLLNLLNGMTGTPPDGRKDGGFVASGLAKRRVGTGNKRDRTHDLIQEIDGQRLFLDRLGVNESLRPVQQDSKLLPRANLIAQERPNHLDHAHVVLAAQFPSEDDGVRSGRQPLLSAAPAPAFPFPGQASLPTTPICQFPTETASRTWRFSTSVCVHRHRIRLLLQEPAKSLSIWISTRPGSFGTGLGMPATASASPLQRYLKAGHETARGSSAQAGLPWQRDQDGQHDETTSRHAMHSLQGRTRSSRVPWRSPGTRLGSTKRH